jgi:D-glycero-D-manno-heptose 1,7-bisphosphate phosphatase
MMTPPNFPSHPAVFLDRDGVLNELVFNPTTGAHESPHTPEELHLLPGVAEAARRLQAAGFALFIVSNQPSYAKGKTSLENIHAIAALVERRLADAGVRIWRSLYCLHHPAGTVAPYAGACRCRKPKPQLLFDARDEFDLDLASSWMIGDQDSDIECGRRAGCRTISVANPLSRDKRPGVERPTLNARDLPDAVMQLLAHSRCGTGVPARE